jgi:hypothetical protein
MYDSYADGWNGGTITLDDGAGNVLATDGLSGFVASGSFTVQVGSTVSCDVLVVLMLMQITMMLQLL